MSKRLLQCAAALAVTIGAHNASAATLAVVPAAAQVSVGGTVQVGFTIAGLGDLSAPSLGAYDLDIDFDAGLLNFSGVSWGDPLQGSQLDLARLGSYAQIDSSHAGSGKLNLFEFSFDDIAALNNLQAGSFTLFTLSFTAVAKGAASISIGVNALGDAYGNDLAAQVSNGSVSAVPVPASLPLFTSALLAMVVGRRRRIAA